MHIHMCTQPTFKARVLQGCEAQGMYMKQTHSLFELQLTYAQETHTGFVVTTVNMSLYAYETNTWSAVTTNNLCV